MNLFNEKWNHSSMVTKVPAFAMALDAFLLLICSIVFFALGGQASEAAALGVLVLILFLYNALLAFGLCKLNRAARVAAIIGGLIIAFPFILYVILFIVSLIKFPMMKTLLEMEGALLKNTLPMIAAFVPAGMKGLVVFLMIIFIGPMVLNVAAMLILFFRGGDFKGEGKPKSKLIAYLLWFFLGWVSAHKFYLEKDGTGILFFFTGQILTFGWIVNLFTLGKQVDAYNAKLEAESQAISQN